MFKKVSFVIPAYNEAESLPELVRQIKEQLQKCLSMGLVCDYEILFVDDGSKDHTESLLKQFHEEDTKIRYIIFRKNFGKSPALQAGLHHVTGDAVITMDSDLQDDPVEIIPMLNKLDEGWDMVVGWKVNRQDPAEKKLPSKLFNKVVSSLSGLKLHDFDCGYKAMTGACAQALKLYGELHRYIPVLAYNKGFRITEIPVHHNPRIHGKSKYGMERYLRGLFDCLTVTFLSRYQDRPMYFFGKAGLGSLGIGFLACLACIVEVCLGITTGVLPLFLTGILLLAAGALFLSLGLIGNLIVNYNLREDYPEERIRELV